jgi:hypothetical protein
MAGVVIGIDTDEDVPFGVEYGPYDGGDLTDEERRI